LIDIFCIELYSGQNCILIKNQMTIFDILTSIFNIL